jgi:hypothetical protein
MLVGFSNWNNVAFADEGSFRHYRTRVVARHM